MLVETCSTIPVFRQCDLVNLARSSFYYQPRRDELYNENLMRLLDEEYTRHPFYGRPKMTAWLQLLGAPGKSQADWPVNAGDGHPGNFPPKESVKSQPEGYKVSISIDRNGNYPSQSSMVR